MLVFTRHLKKKLLNTRTLLLFEFSLITYIYFDGKITTFNRRQKKRLQRSSNQFLQTSFVCKSFILGKKANIILNNKWRLLWAYPSAISTQLSKMNTRPMA